MKLLDAVVAAPEDDTPRLVYADALTERGDARGELITVQCTLARGRLARATAIALRRREQELLATHGQAWTADLQGLATAWRFHRGFVEEVTVDARVLLARADELVAKAPLVRRLVLAGLSDGPTHETPPHPGAGALVDRVLDSPALARVRELDLQEPISYSEHEGEFSNSTRGDRLSDAVLAQLARPGRLRRLEGLAIEGATAAGLRALAECPDAGGLRWLSLRGWFGADGRTALASPTTALRPRRLALLDRLVTGTLEDGIGELAQAPALERVEHLRLDCVRTRALEALVASPLAPRLRTLDVATTLSARSWELLADSPRLSGLEELAVGGAMAAGSVPLVDRFGETLDYRPLLQAKGLQALRVLRLNSAHVTAELADALLASPLVRRLEVLDLRNNPWLKGRSASELRQAFDGVLECGPLPYGSASAMLAQAQC